MTTRELELAIASGTATLDDFTGIEPADVLAIKRALPYRRGLGGRLLAHDDDSKTVEMVFNGQVVDRTGDLILSNPKDAEKRGGAGWDLTYIELAGSPFLHLHDADFVIGRIESFLVRKIDVPKRDDSSGRAWALTGKVRFFDDGRLPFSQGDYLLVREGITGTSVGFIPRLIVDINDDKERGKIGLGPWGALIASAELLEVSFAPIPANQVSTTGAPEKAVDAALTRFVDEGKMPASLAADYRRFRPMGPTDQAERLADKLRSVFLPLAQTRGWEAPDGVTLECTEDGCRFHVGGIVGGGVTKMLGMRDPPWSVVPLKPGGALSINRCDCEGSRELAELRAFKAGVEAQEGGEVASEPLETTLDVGKTLEQVLDGVECLKLGVAALAKTGTVANLEDLANSGGAATPGEGKAKGGDPGTGAVVADGDASTTDAAVGGSKHVRDVDTTAAEVSAHLNL